MFKEIKKTNPIEEHFQEESSQEQTTLVLTGLQATHFPRIEEIF